MGDLYAGHSIMRMVNAGWSIEECQYQNAEWQSSAGHLIKEATDFYPNPYDDEPEAMPLAAKRREIARRVQSGSA